MSAQLSLIDAIAFQPRPKGPAPADGTLRPVVVSSRDAIAALGCRAPEVPVHQVLPQIPGVSDETAAAMLSLAEDAVRYNATPTARIDDRLSARNRAGSNGPIGSGLVISQGKDVRHIHTEERISWTRLLAALRHAREMEPQVARARDLAEARRYLHYYARAYGPSGPPPALLPRIREEIAALGGDPDEQTEGSR